MMDRISKFFGKKNEPPASGRSDSREASGSTGGIDKGQADLLDESGSSATSQPKNPADQAGFGLKFSLETGEERLFTSLPISIGRGDHNDMVLKYDTVSNVHALIYFDERVQDVCILDQGSLNGIMIDGLPTGKNVLHDGVKIRFGDALLTFRDTGYIHGQ
jgi:pSer/pThr/pTyr-binding forkhead associated (FHA) protein